MSSRKEHLRRDKPQNTPCKRNKRQTHNWNSEEDFVSVTFELDDILVDDDIVTQEIEYD
jgi:hypothetical protein